MGTDKATIETSGKTFSGPAGEQALVSLIGRRSDFTNATFEAMDIAGRDWEKCAFDGALFRECIFTKCGFQRSEFEGATFEKCEFVDCDLSVADLRSIRMAGCVFLCTKLDHCEFRFSEVMESRFVECSMIHQTFSENTFYRCAFLSCTFSRGAVHHVVFRETKFENTTFSDCTALYLIFRKCEFTDAKFNVQTIGTSLGFSEQDLARAGLVWQGDDLERPSSGNLIIDLLTTFQARDWRFGAAIIELNFGLKSRLDGLRSVLAATVGSLRSGRPAKRDEIIFVERITATFIEDGVLPLLFLFDVLDTIRAVDTLASAAELSILRRFYYLSVESQRLLITKLDTCLRPLLKDGVTVSGKVKIRFERKPGTDVPEWLTAALAGVGLAQEDIRELRQGSGSWIVELQMAAQCLALLIVILFLVEGVIHRLTLIRARATILLSPGLPSKIRRQAIEQPKVPSKEVLRILKPAARFVAAESGRRVVAGAHEIAKLVNDLEFSESSPPS